MRLTLDLLQQAPQSLNPAKQRQLMLRGFKIPTIENLGGTNDAYECIDLSDNDLIKVDNFPPLKRLHVLMLMNNRISRIALDAFDPLPNLQAVILTGNKLEKLVDLEALTKLKTLERLSLLDNPVTKVKHYRSYMISKCSKTLRILDFNRIKDAERKAAAALFQGERGQKLLEEIAPARVVGQIVDKAEAKTGPSAETVERIKKAIAEAATLEEVTRLEKALKTGIMPGEEPATPAAPAEGEKASEAAPAAAAPAAAASEAPAAEAKEAAPAATAEGDGPAPMETS